MLKRKHKWTCWNIGHGPNTLIRNTKPSEWQTTASRFYSASICKFVTACWETTTHNWEYIQHPQRNSLEFLIDSVNALGTSEVIDEPCVWLNNFFRNQKTRIKNPNKLVRTTEIHYANSSMKPLRVSGVLQSTQCKARVCPRWIAQETHGHFSFFWPITYSLIAFPVKDLERWV